MLHPETGIKLGEEVDALREENARLRGYMRPDQIEEAETVAKLISERDEARAEAKLQQQAGRVHMAEVARLREWQSKTQSEGYQIARLEAEVARLEGLILDWAETPENNFDPRDTLLAEARRIRAQREEGRE